VRYIRRHRLEKDPNAAISDPVKRFYKGSTGAPEDVKKALVEGASWWTQRSAAGFRNGFKVAVLRAAPIRWTSATT
jgi:hypothetical protein